MDPVIFTARIISLLQLTSTVVGDLNDVKDAPKERVQCSTEASNLFNLLNNLNYLLEEADTNSAWYTALRALAVADGPLDQYKSALDQLQPKVGSNSGITKVGNALLWRFSKQKVNDILLRMKRLKTLLLIALEMDHSKLSQAIKTWMDTLHSDTQDIQEDQKCQQHLAITNWISSIDFTAQQSDIISRRQAGTGVWFTDSPEFRNWLQGSNQTLFCPGIPGAGKTMIAAIAVDHLWKHVRQKDIGIVHIYCNYKTQAAQTPTNLAATILKQLVHQQPSVAEQPVADLYGRHADRKLRPSLPEVLRVLKTVISNYSKVYVVVDALDECMDHDDSRSQLLILLRSLQSTGNLNLMVTSRFIQELVAEFSLLPTLEVQASDSDVKCFVAGQIYRLPKCVHRDEELQRAIEDRISVAVDARFLLARLHLDSLLDNSTKKMILSTLDTLPKGAQALDEAYQHAIDRIERQLPGNSQLAKSVLSWITYAQIPLTTGELCHALAVEPGESELDPDNIPHIEDIVSVCAGLIAVDYESDIVRLVHFTTQEYFERILEEWNPQAQLDIASACLTYLSFRAFRSGSCPNDEEFESRLDEHKFLDYAARFWAEHTRTVQEQAYELAFIFLQDVDLISCAIQTMSVSEYKYSDYSQNFPRQTTGLHLTARVGLLFLTERLLSGLGENIDFAADSKDEYGQTPLSWAATGGYERVVRILVERKDVVADSKDRFGRTPLSWAAERGHEAAVRLLAERDDVVADSKDNDDQTPLLWAAVGGYEAVVRLLVERDDVAADSMDRFGRTPLSRAAERGHKAVVRLLVERDDVVADSKNNFGWTPLWQAAAGGYEAAVRLLVERDDVVVNSKDEDDQTPLAWAAAGGYEAVVRLLVERDDVVADSKDNNGQTPLLQAAARGHEAVVRLLVERDDVTAGLKDEDGQTPLSWAAGAGHEAVVKVLVEQEDVVADSKDEWGRTPLSQAAAGGHEAVVRLLVERGDVIADLKDEDGRTPLSFAAGSGHEAVVRMLVERDDVVADSKDEDGQTPLSWAVKGGHEAIARLLEAKRLGLLE